MSDNIDRLLATGIPLDDNEDDPIARDESELNETDQEEEEEEIEFTKVTVPILAQVTTRPNELHDFYKDEVIEEELFGINELNFAQSMTRTVELHDLYKGEAIEEESNLNGWGEKMVIGFFS